MHKNKQPSTNTATSPFNVYLLSMYSRVFCSGPPGPPPPASHIPGCVPSPPVPPSDHASVSGHTPVTPETTRRTEARQRRWDEDSLCSPLTRAQRASARPGQSLPAGYNLATDSTGKSFSLGNICSSMRLLHVTVWRI